MDIIIIIPGHFKVSFYFESEVGQTTVTVKHTHSREIRIVKNTTHQKQPGILQIFYILLNNELQ